MSAYHAWPRPPLHRLRSVVAYHALHACISPPMSSLACMNSDVRAVLPLDATAWRSPALCIRLEPARDCCPARSCSSTRSSSSSAPPLLVYVCVCPPPPVACASCLPHRTGARDPPPLAVNAYLSPLPCRPLRIRTLRTSPPPRALSPQSPPRAERRPVIIVIKRFCQNTRG